MLETQPRTRITREELVAWLTARAPLSPLLAARTLTSGDVVTITGASRTKLNGIIHTETHAYPGKVAIVNKAYLYDMDAVIRWLQTHNPLTIVIPAKKTKTDAPPRSVLRLRPASLAKPMPVNLPLLVRTHYGLSPASPAPAPPKLFMWTNAIFIKRLGRMCNCRTDITNRLLERFKEQSPEATNHYIELTGYAFIFGKEMEMAEKGCMEIKATANFPLKKGGVKEKTTKQNMIFTFCPFCAEPYGTKKIEANAQLIAAAPEFADVSSCT